MPKKPMSIEQSARAVLDALAKFGPAGEVSDLLVTKDAATKAAWLGRLYMKWELPGWGLEAFIQVRWKYNGGVWEPSVEANWCSTRYEPSAAVAAARLHMQVAEFACLLETLLNQHDTIICEATKDLPKEK